MTVYVTEGPQRLLLPCLQNVGHYLKEKLQAPPATSVPHFYSMSHPCTPQGLLALGLSLPSSCFSCRRGLGDNFSGQGTLKVVVRGVGLSLLGVLQEPGGILGGWVLLGVAQPASHIVLHPVCATAVAQEEMVWFVAAQKGTLA